MSWQYHEKSKEQIQDKDFLEMNKKSAVSGCSKSKVRERQADLQFKGTDSGKLNITFFFP